MSACPLLAFGLAILASTSCGQTLPQSCNSAIYCYGDILKDVQLARLFNDSKTFVDMKLKAPESVITARYAMIRLQYSGTPPTDVIQAFVHQNFEVGDELVEDIPHDWVARPSLVSKLRDPRFQSWVLGLNNVFLNLTRKVKEDVFNHPDLYSFLPVPNRFVIPGGRFLELYYWDSYWIVRGLLLCDMWDTARGVIENLLYLLAHYKFIPNGSRKYYLNRSQPPLVTRMMDIYLQNTNDMKFLERNIKLLEVEYRYFVNHNSVKIRKDGATYMMFRYYAPSQGPRPESYREDYNTASTLSTDAEKTKVYISLKSGAESGHDFSTRWFIKGGTNNGNISDIQTPYILPVDLNSIMHYNLYTLSNFYQRLGDPSKAAYYQGLADKLLDAIEEILWDPIYGMWFDYDLLNNKPRDYFYLSNITPLWTGSFRTCKKSLTRSVLSYLAKYNITQYNGAPTSVYRSGEQWDFPNAWAPLQSFLIEGLQQLGTEEANCAARYYALKWINTNYQGWVDGQVMFEKYDVELLGRTGEGGEYEFQTGFGWTNGLILQLLNDYSDYCVEQMRREIETYRCPC